MKALSFKQPWASLVCAGIVTPEGRRFKDIDNRTWSTNMRGQIFVHASKGFDEPAVDWLRAVGIWDGVANVALNPDLVPRGAIIGTVEITDCVTQSDSIWFTGPYGFVLANPVLFTLPVPCKGMLGFFVPELGSNVRLIESQIPDVYKARREIKNGNRMQF